MASTANAAEQAITVRNTGDGYDGNGHKWSSNWSVAAAGAVVVAGGILSDRVNCNEELTSPLGKNMNLANLPVVSGSVHLQFSCALRPVRALLTCLIGCKSADTVTQSRTQIGTRGVDVRAVAKPTGWPPLLDCAHSYSSMLTCITPAIPLLRIPAGVHEDNLRTGCAPADHAEEACARDRGDGYHGGAAADDCLGRQVPHLDLRRPRECTVVVLYVVAGAGPGRTTLRDICCGALAHRSSLSKDSKSRQCRDRAVCS